MMDFGGVTFEEPTAGPVEEEEELTGPVHDRLQAIMRSDFEHQLRDNPEFATQVGFHEHDSRLQDCSPAAFEMRLQYNERVLAKFAALDLQDPSVTSKDRLHVDLLRAGIQGETDAIRLNCHTRPINSIGGMGTLFENFFEMLEWMNFESAEDVQTYLNRLMEFPAQMTGYMDLLAYGGCMAGMPASRVMVEGATKRLEELIASDLSELRAPIRGLDFEADAFVHLDQAIENGFREPLKRLHAFLTGFYDSRVTLEPGCPALKNGAQVYAQCLIFHTNTLKTPEQIHDMGLREVTRIEERVQREVLDVLGFKGSFAEFATGLKENPEFFFDTEDELLQGYREIIERIQEKLPQYFNQQPRMPLVVARRTAGPMAFYMQGTQDGKRPGTFSVNVTNLSERPKYGMTVLALHEGVPGHHLQGALAIENESLPDFLRYTEDRRYEYCPARRPLYAGYLEGWALYCEALGEEMAMYTTPHELFGRLSAEIWRAVRLVADTGIHAYGWSVDRAAAYMEEKTGMARDECHKECRRYAAWPGQACGYKVGEMALLEIRQSAESALGAKFDIKAFHDVVLGSGPLPMNILDGLVREWVSARQSD
eukprot:CAMPEP_0194512808 /NCGR_PEP_ID=MMETSP0253-20130528/44936_1 /TAXON_ID=2966 /ORGANISM="Noctiluca scintillans" /LENGTH=595 /DNA_ID=CAMNT_0039356309 /DNA_START=64 /DNA_END=1851 /DNA_ORIENTATION=-